MSSSTGHTLDVPGARLYYEVEGSGPALMLVGHPMGPLGFVPIAPVLAEKFTVVTYDPRGFGRSTIDDSDQDAEPDLLADDVCRVLEQVDEGPAYVFGSSRGAVTDLALVARHPNRVATLIAHEPPVALLLPKAEEARTGLHEIYDTYLASGISAAWERFFFFTGMRMPPTRGDSEPPSGDAIVTSDRFFRHGLLPIALYRPDLTALHAAPTRVVIAGGTTSKGEFAARTAVALAQQLGTPLVDFPGGHSGFASDPGDFAVVLRRTLAD